MGRAWGKSWGDSWGDSWGKIEDAWNGAWSNAWSDSWGHVSTVAAASVAKQEIPLGANTWQDLWPLWTPKATKRIAGEGQFAAIVPDTEGEGEVRRRAAGSGAVAFSVVEISIFGTVTGPSRFDVKAPTVAGVASVRQFVNPMEDFLLLAHLFD